MGLAEQFAEELALIKKAPYTFVIGFVVLAGLTGAGEYTLFKESLTRKDNVIKDKDDLIKTLQDKQSAKVTTPAATDKSQAGSATANGGSGNTVNTGSGNTFENDAPPKQKQK